MMDNEVQLNISAPILTIRNHLTPRATASETAGIETEKSPTGGELSLLVDRSEWESEEATKPVAVPFLWERAPGRPKGNCLYHSSEEPGITPRPPPGRLFEVCTLRPPPGGINNAQNLKGEACPSPRPPPRRLLEVCNYKPPLGVIHNERNSKDECPSPRPPPRRLFEVCSYKPPPGGIHNAQKSSGEACLSLRLLLPGRIFGGICSPRLHPSSVDIVDAVYTSRPTSEKLTDLRHISGGKSVGQNNTNCQAEAFTTTDRASLPQSLKECLDADVESDKDSGADAFYDALDTLSPNETLSLKSSFSGLSSSYHRNYGTSGKFFVDPQARAFMMSRFLPAGKAQHVLEKRTVFIGEQKTLHEFIYFERNPLLKQPGLNARSSSNQHLKYLKHEDVEYDDPEIRLGNTSGVFQRPCVNNSVTRLNPKSGMKLNPQSSRPSSGKVKKGTRDNAYCRPVDKCVYDATCKQIYPSEVTSQELPKVRTTLTCNPKRIAFSSNSCKMANGISPTIRRSGGIDPVRNENPPSAISEGDLFLALPKPIEPKTDEISPLVKRDHDIKVSTQGSNRQGFEPQVVPVANTTYEHSLQKKVRCMKSNYSKSKRPYNSLTKNLETMAGSDAVCDFSSTGMVSTTTCNSGPSGMSPIMEECNQEHNFIGMEELKGGEKSVNGQQKSKSAILLHPLPLPLPTSPSESWIWRTRPSTNLQTSFSQSHVHSRLQCVSKKMQPSK